MQVITRVAQHLMHPAAVKAFQALTELLTHPISAWSFWAGRNLVVLVEMPAASDKPAQQFRLGTGFTDADRLHPPQVGSLVTYRFRGSNAGRIPRFASFMRVREDPPGQ